MRPPSSCKEGWEMQFSSTQEASGADLTLLQRYCCNSSCDFSIKKYSGIMEICDA